jgi:hypothetical protein
MNNAEARPCQVALEIAFSIARADQRVAVHLACGYRDAGTRPHCSRPAATFANFFTWMGGRMAG